MKIRQKVCNRNLKWLQNTNVLFAGMKLIFKIFLIFLTICCINFYNFDTGYTQTLLQGSVEMVPDGFFGTWRVSSKLIETDSPETFKQKGVDLWNLSAQNDVIILCNPFSGASAKISIKNAGKTFIEFSKTGKYEDKILTDKVSINMEGDSFTGVNEIKLETLSGVDGSIIKTRTAKYAIKGERISGQDIIK